MKLIRVVLLCCVLLLTPWAWAAPTTVLVWGDSLSAGYGIRADQAWPALLGKKLGPGYRIVNASVSGETTAGGRTRFPAALKSHHPGLVILALGANDGLRGLPVAEMQKNLAGMIEAAQKAGARVHLVGMQMPPNYGDAYTQAFAGVYPALAKQYKLTLTPFLLAPVIERPELFQPDQLHPTAAGQPLLADMMARDLAPVISKKNKK
ncbi:arylesterase [Chitinibacteraceae bacterium HSL-7]